MRGKRGKQNFRIHHCFPLGTFSGDHVLGFSEIVEGENEFFVPWRWLGDPQVWLSRGLITKINLKGPHWKNKKDSLIIHFFTGACFLGMWGFSCPNNYVSRELGILLHSQKHHQEWISEVVMPKCNGGELFEFLANETEAWKFF